MALTVGADAEGFVRLAGETIAVTGLIKAGKRKPLIVTNGNLQEDNALAEFAIDVTESEDQFVQYVLNVRQQLWDKCGNVDFTASHTFDLEYLQTIGQKVMEFGCDSDFNVYSHAPNRAPVAEEVGGLRTAGGHLHFGYDNPSRQKTADIIKAMDIFLGIPSVIMDADRVRRTMYGKAGSFRFKPYGGEYRVLSSFWVDNEKLIRWAYRNLDQAFHTVEEDMLQYYQQMITDEEVQHIINNYDVGAAMDAVTTLGLDVITGAGGTHV